MEHVPIEHSRKWIPRPLPLSQLVGLGEFLISYVRKKKQRFEKESTEKFAIPKKTKKKLATRKKKKRRLEKKKELATRKKSDDRKKIKNLCFEKKKRD
jgi:hypothetical protein